MSIAAPTRPDWLSKSRVMTGLQCHRLLWWMVHEPMAPELVPDPQTSALMDQGSKVGELAPCCAHDTLALVEILKALRATGSVEAFEAGRA